jgi:hypothetical protein
MTGAVILDDETIRQHTFFNAGREWAQSLKPGDIFRGSYGEAVWRGLTGWDAKFFSAGGQVDLHDKSIILASHDSNVIRSID